MGKVSNDFKLKIVEERILNKKKYTEIEDEYGVRRGTTYDWVKRYHEGTLFIDKRNTFKNDTYDDYEFLKKSLALLKKIRSKSHK